jgi:hypothetical protein
VRDMLDCGTTVELFIIFVSVSCLLHWATMVHVQWFVFIELHVSKHRDLCLLWKVFCDQSSWTYSHVMLWVHKNTVQGPLFIVWVLCWVLFLLWLVWHVGALPKVIQSPCLVTRDDAYMGNLTYVPCDGCILVTVVMMLKSSSGDTHHFVES